MAGERIGSNGTSARWTAAAGAGHAGKRMCSERQAKARGAKARLNSEPRVVRAAPCATGMQQCQTASDRAGKGHYPVCEAAAFPCLKLARHRKLGRDRTRSEEPHCQNARFSALLPCLRAVLPRAQSRPAARRAPCRAGGWCPLQRKSPAPCLHREGRDNREHCVSIRL